MISTSHKTVRLTTAQAVVKYLAAQHSVADGARRRLVPAVLGIFGHGNIAGWARLSMNSPTSCRSSRAATSSIWRTSPPPTPRPPAATPRWP